MSNEGTSSRDILFLEPSYLNHGVAPGEVSLRCRYSPWLPLISAQHDPAEAAVVLQDPIFQGRGMGGAETYSPAR